jgi:signal transduction histidine kinase
MRGTRGGKVTATSATDSRPASESEVRLIEPLGARILTAALVTVVLTLLVLGRDDIGRVVAKQGWQLLAWAAIVTTVDLFPIALGRIRLTLDLSVLLATGLLYPPAVAAVLGFVAALDVREIRREIGAASALFNRAQIAISLYAAAWTFDVLAGEVAVSPSAIGATLAALLVDFMANVAFVALFVLLREQGDVAAARREFEVANRTLLVITHLGYGVLAFILAVLAKQAGLWSVGLFLVPIVAARQLLIRNEELKRTSDQLRQRERLLEQLFRGTLDERRDERMRIARELHDDVLQVLTRIQQIADTLKVRVGERLSDNDVNDLQRAAHVGMRAMRSVMHDLRQSPLGPGGLVPTLRRLVQECQFRSTARILLQQPESLEADEEVLLAAYQVAREGLANALKHSEASVVRLSLAEEGGCLEVEVVDNGVGFIPEDVRGMDHFGIDLMKERVELAGGQMAIHSRLGAGTRVAAVFPGAGSARKPGLGGNST